jgi:hypothetical protein
MGFCFSFPVEQTSIGKGKIAFMTKKFTNPGAKGADPVALLESACQKAGQKVPVIVLACIVDIGLESWNRSHPGHGLQYVEALLNGQFPVLLTKEDALLNWLSFWEAAEAPTWVAEGGGGQKACGFILIISLPGRQF